MQARFKASERPAIGIVKHVYIDNTEDEIKEEIYQEYPNADCEFFKKNEEFMGIIKIKFENNEDLSHAMTNRLSIFNERYKVEDYIAKRRVIRCMRCQTFGHVARLCLKPKPVCGKCTSNSHETNKCTIAEDNYKCYHCKENHMSGDKNCRVIKEKEEELNQSA